MNACPANTYCSHKTLQLCRVTDSVQVLFIKRNKTYAYVTSRICNSVLASWYGSRLHSFASPHAEAVILIANSHDNLSVPLQRQHLHIISHSPCRVPSQCQALNKVSTWLNIEFSLGTAALCRARMI